MTTEIKIYFILLIVVYKELFEIRNEIKNKSEVIECFKDYVRMTQSKFNYRISKLRCDNGGEYSSKEMFNDCIEEGIILDYTVPYTPQQNGKAERMNRSLVERARAIINDSGIPKNLWNEAIRTVAYLMNRGPTSCIEGVTPAEIWFKRKPKVNNLRIFGCIAYNHTQKEFRNKFYDKVEKSIMVGYAPNGYRLWNVQKQKVIISRDVKFDENSFWYNKKSVQIYIDENQDENKDKQERKDTDEDSNDESSLNKDVNVKKPGRIIKKPLKLADNELYMAYRTMSFIEDAPCSFEEVKQREDKELWLEAMSGELESINKDKTWEMVEARKDVEVLDTKWVYTYKPYTLRTSKPQTYDGATRKQNNVALSSTEAELTALTVAVSEGLWLKKLLDDFGIPVKELVIFEDNQACIHLIKNPGSNRKVKHISIKYNFIQDKVLSGELKVVYIESKKQSSDIFTKGHPESSFYDLCYGLGMRHFAKGVVKDGYAANANGY